MLDWGIRNKIKPAPPFHFRFSRPQAGDYVVHVDHGIGLFNGLKTIGLNEGSKEFVLLTYQNDARLYVPVERLDLIQNTAAWAERVQRWTAWSTSWARTKSRIKKSMRDMAEELLKLYAQRKMVRDMLSLLTPPGNRN